MVVRVLIVDDHVLMRDGLRSILERDAGVRVVGEAGDGSEAVTKVIELVPDVVLMDVSMPGLDGVEAVRRLVAKLPSAKVLGLSASIHPRQVRAMFDAGAVGYLAKTATEEELRRAVHAVAKHGAYVSPEVSAVLLRGSSPPSGSDAPPSLLTDREREVVRLVAEGRTSKEIAALLRLSPATVETYRRNIADKLGLHSVAEITRYAIRNGLTSVD